MSRELRFTNCPHCSNTEHAWYPHEALLIFKAGERSAQFSVYTPPPFDANIRPTSNTAKPIAVKPRKSAGGTRISFRCVFMSRAFSHIIAPLLPRLRNK